MLSENGLRSIPVSIDMTGSLSVRWGVVQAYKISLQQMLVKGILFCADDANSEYSGRSTKNKYRKHDVCLRLNVILVIKVFISELGALMCVFAGTSLCTNK